VTVLAGLGGRHVDNLAGAALNHDEAVLAEGRALHGVCGRRAGVNRLEGVVMLEREKTLVSHTEEPPQGYKHLELLLRLSHPERIKTSSRSHSVAIFGTHVEAMERP
jgi:hypothetical protein